MVKGKRILLNRFADMSSYFSLEALALFRELGI